LLARAACVSRRAGKGGAALKNWVNWALVIGGVFLVVLEVALGTITGFDLALLGVSLVAGGAIGLIAGSTKVGLFSAGAIAFIYLAFLRRTIRSKLTSPHKPLNTDALVGRHALVTERIAPHAPGMVRVGDELWRAAVPPNAEGAIEAGATVTVVSIEGVTLGVKVG
jgi:membrane protein implicated in regulation of membrane protease activity